MYWHDEQLLKLGSEKPPPHTIHSNQVAIRLLTYQLVNIITSVASLLYMTTMIQCSVWSACDDASLCPPRVCLRLPSLMLLASQLAGQPANQLLLLLLAVVIILIMMIIIIMIMIQTIITNIILLLSLLSLLFSWSAFPPSSQPARLVSRRALAPQAPAGE